MFGRRSRTGWVWIVAAACLGVGLAGSATPGRADEGRCLIVVDGKAYLKGRCNIEIRPGGNFTVGAGENSTSEHFAYVNPDGRDEAQGYWNGRDADSHAGSDLGTLKRKGACWSNSRAKVCAWRLN
jgi:hypothetical protein